MPSFSERVRNLFTDKLQAPAPEEISYQVEVEARVTEQKMAESHRMGEAALIADVAGYLQESRMELTDYWAHDLASGNKEHAVLDERFMAVLAEQNRLAQYLRDYAKDSGLSLDTVPEIIDLPAERLLAHKDAAYQQEVDWVMEMQPDNHIGNEPGQSMHDYLAERWTRDLLRSPEESEAIRDHYLERVAEHNAKPSEYRSADISFDQLEREVLSELKSEVNFCADEDLYGEDKEKYLAKYDHVLYPESVSAQYVDSAGMTMTKEQMLDYEEEGYIQEPVYVQDPVSEQPILTWDLAGSRQVLADQTGEVLATVWTNGEGFDATAGLFLDQGVSLEDGRFSSAEKARLFITHVVTAPSYEYENASVRVSETLQKQEVSAGISESVQSSHRMETPGQSAEDPASRYAYLDVAIQQLSQANSATVTRELSQPWTISQPQQAVFIQPERAQQLAAETPEVQRDFGVSL